MKIHIEADSTQELLGFIKEFAGTTSLINKQVVLEIPSSPEEEKTLHEKCQEPQNEVKEVIQDKAVSEEKKEDQANPQEEKEDPKTEEEPKITKEMVRAVFTKLIKSGKQKEAKELTAKYGASKLPDLKEEDYAAVYKEAEGLV